MKKKNLYMVFFLLMLALPALACDLDGEVSRTVCSGYCVENTQRAVATVQAAPVVATVSSEAAQMGQDLKNEAGQLSREAALAVCLETVGSINQEGVDHCHKLWD